MLGAIPGKIWTKHTQRVRPLAPLPLTLRLRPFGLSQDKIRLLEEDKSSLQEQLRLTGSARERDESQHRTLQRQLQLQLQAHVLLQHHPARPARQTEPRIPFARPSHTSPLPDRATRPLLPCKPYD